MLVSLKTFFAKNKMRDAFLYSKGISSIFQLKFEYGKAKETTKYDSKILKQL